MIKAFTAVSTVLALASWADGELLCAGQVNPELGASRLPGPAKATQAQISSTGSGIVLFAHFRDELPADAALPNWADDIFDPDQPGSFSHFYDTMSFGHHRFRGHVAPSRYAPLDPTAEYVAEDPGTEGRYSEFALEIIQAADVDIDYSRYDNDGPDGLPDSGDDDGYVDAVFIVMSSVPAGFIFGGATGVGRLRVDEFLTDDIGSGGQRLRVHGGQVALQLGRSFAETVGSMCHEYGHILGLPDLFDVQVLRSKGPLDPADDSAGIGRWGLMGWGAQGWNGDDGPSSFGAWSRWQLGWTDAVEVGVGTESIQLADVGTGGPVAKVPLDEKEFFLLAHRRVNTYYDRRLPGEGLLIWHVQPGMPGAWPPIVDVECADGRWRDAGYPQGRERTVSSRMRHLA